MANIKEEVQIIGNKEELPDEQKRFIDFCMPLRDYQERQKYLFSRSAYQYFNKNNPDILEIEKETYGPFPYKEILSPNSTGARTIAFLKSANNFYFYRVTGGCVAYEDDLFGPFIFQNGKFIKIASALGLSQKKDEGLTKSQIIQAALNKAKELGYKLEEMTVTYDEDNKAIKEHLKRIGISTYNEKTKEWEKDLPTILEKEYPKLAGRDYQAVYFGPQTRGLCSDLWVFIDKNTGEVITYTRGK